jgi:hypothetical protein
LERATKVYERLEQEEGTGSSKKTGGVIKTKDRCDKGSRQAKYDIYRYSRRSILFYQYDMHILPPIGLYISKDVTYLTFLVIIGSFAALTDFSERA